MIYSVEYSKLLDLYSRLLDIYDRSLTIISTSRHDSIHSDSEITDLSKLLDRWKINSETIDNMQCV